MKNSRKLLSIILSLVMMLSLCVGFTGCSKNDDSKPKAEASTTLPDNVIVDQLGRQVEIPEKIEKIAATHVYGGKMLFAMGQKSKLAYQLQLGADTDAIAEIDKEYGALPTIESTANGTDSPEALVEFGVDVVFTDAAEGTESCDLYENAGITAIAVSGETVEEVEETADIMAKVLGAENEAKRLKDFMHKKLDLVTSRTAKLSEKDKPVVLVTGSGGIHTAATKTMFQHQMVEMAGGINAGADYTGRWARISSEDIIAKDPDFIVLGSSFGVDTVDTILADKALAPVTAIKNKDVYIFPSTLGWWDFPMPQSVLGIIWTGTIIHPELFEDVNIMDEANEVYKFMYGYTYEELGGKISSASLNK